MKKYLYMFVREDLRPSQITVQSIHSAFELGKNIEKQNTEHPSVVLLKAKDEIELNIMMEKIVSLGLKITSFKEPYYNNSLTSFCVEPINESQRGLFKKYKLLRDHDFKIRN